MKDYGLKNLRADFAAAVKPANSRLAPLRIFSLVGAFPGINGLPQGGDLKRLVRTLEIFNQCGIPVAPDFEIDIVNLHAEMGGRDFLKETKPADVVMLCFVFNPDREDDDCCGKDDNAYFSTSAQHFHHNVWHDSALRVGAKMISIFHDDGSFGGSTCIGPGHFQPGAQGSAYIRFEDPLATRMDFAAPDILRHKEYVRN